MTYSTNTLDSTNTYKFVVYLQLHACIECQKNKNSRSHLQNQIKSNVKKKKLILNICNHHDYLFQLTNKSL